MLACMRVCMQWDFLLEHSGTRAADPNVASHSLLLDHRSNIRVQILVLPLAS